MSWEIQRGKTNVMKCVICNICGLSFQKLFGNICGPTTIGLKHLDQFFKLLATFRKIYSAQILLFPDILLLYYLRETDLISRSIWEKYFVKILGRNTHLMVHTSTGTKYCRFKYGIPARLQDTTILGFFWYFFSFKSIF